MAMSQLRWFRRTLGVALIAISVTRLAGVTCAQSILTEPDFSGMHTSGGYVSTVARDSERGWNYVGGPYLSHLGGVATGGAISRVNDAGFADQNWRTTDNFTSTGLGAMMVTSAGVLLVQKGSLWHRMMSAADGSYASVPLHSAVARDGLTSGADGYVYSVQNVYRANAPSQSSVKRLLPSGEYDSGWSMTIDSFSSGVRTIAVAANGDVAYVEGLLAGELKPAIAKRRSSGELQWRRSVIGLPTMSNCSPWSATPNGWSTGFATAMWPRPWTVRLPTTRRNENVAPHVSAACCGSYAPTPSSKKYRAAIAINSAPRPATLSSLSWPPETRIPNNSRPRPPRITFAPREEME